MVLSIGNMVSEGHQIIAAVSSPRVQRNSQSFQFFLTVIATKTYRENEITFQGWRGFSECSQVLEELWGIPLQIPQLSTPLSRSISPHLPSSRCSNMVSYKFFSQKFYSFYTPLSSAKLTLHRFFFLDGI